MPARHPAGLEKLRRHLRGSLDLSTLASRLFGLRGPVLGQLTSTSVRPAAVLGEVVFLPLIAVGLGLWLNPADPLWIEAAFPWPWFAPLILALRYGPLPGLAGSGLLLAAWLLLNVGHTDDFPKLFFLGGLILIMLAGEFSSLWLARTRRAETIQLYLDQRLETLTRQYYLLRLSHDRLEQDLISRPISMRDALLKLRVRSREGRLVPVSELVEVRDVAREKAIYHKDLLPVVYVVGDMGGKLDSPLYGMFDIRSKVNGMALKEGGTLGEWFIRQPADPYAGYSVKWDGEWQVTYETFRDMGIAYAVGLILIYLLVVAHFGSYLVPLIIMAPIPLTIIGVMPGHALFGSQFTATSMIGMIALAGIIVRNSILLVDFIKQQVAAGMNFHDAVIQSAAVRAKPIALTALAAMLGALPLLLGQAEGAEMRQPLGLAIVGGLVLSQLLTLYTTPVVYLYLDRLRHRVNRWRGVRSDAALETPL